MKRIPFYLAIVAMPALACDDASSKTDPASKPAAATPSGSPAAAQAAAPAAAAPKAEEAKPTLAPLDLGATSPSWKGFRIEAPEGTVPGDDGAGGVSVAMRGGLQVALSPEPAKMAEVKEATKIGAEAVGGTVTFTKETAEEIESYADVKDYEGKVQRVYSATMALDVGGKKMGCQVVGAMSEEDLAVAKGVCKSLKKA